MSLIRHFIRGYFDGDGCISWANKAHTKLCISILGTEAFLNQLMLNLPKHKIYSLLNKNNKQVATKVFDQNGRAAFNTMNFLYNNSTIYLERKYYRFLDACRLYQ